MDQKKDGSNKGRTKTDDGASLTSSAAVGPEILATAKNEKIVLKTLLCLA